MSSIYRVVRTFEVKADTPEGAAEAANRLEYAPPEQQPEEIPYFITNGDPNFRRTVTLPRREP